MKLSLNWLADYMQVDFSVDELVDALTMAGLEVESVEEIGGGISGVVVGRIGDVRPHPNADKLKLCDVSDGASVNTVVCGAPNVRLGMVTAFAQVGAVLPAGMVNVTPIRGIKSSGMLISARELGISEDHSGIMDLPEDLTLGQDIIEALQIKDTVLDLSITPNRPDWLSVIGVAREAAAAFGKDLKRPELTFENEGGPVAELSSVKIEAPELCPRYTGMIVRGVKIGPSPNWMVRRLEAVGLRSINNIVDITNFVQLEVGQPLHAFDFDFLDEHRIVVRECHPGEMITTLDDVERKLPSGSLLICDGAKPVALAGVMGGQNSLVTDQTKDIFIESAYFHPPNIRNTSKAVALSSESSYRFERGVDIEGVKWGLHRAAQLMAELAGGEIVSGYIDTYPGVKSPAIVPLRPARANKVLGTDISAETIMDLLNSIGLKCQSDGDTINVTIPTFRVDIDREVDLIEEVARLYGFDKIEPTIPKGVGASPNFSDERKTQLAVRDAMTALGMDETISFAFTSPKKLNLFKSQPGTYVNLMNPLNEDYSALRDTLLVGLCQACARNLNRQAKQVRLFEARRTYFANPMEGLLPDEPLFLSGIMAGRREGEGWSFDDSKVDFFDLKGVCESLFENLGLSGNVQWEQGDAPYLSSECSARVLYKGAALGHAGILKGDIAAKFDIDTNVYIFEFNLAKVQSDVLPLIKFQAQSKFPITTRDIAIVLDSGIQAEKVRRTILRVDPELIRDVIIFDVYSGDKVGPGLKSLAFSVRMQKPDSEVSESEAEQVIRKALGVLMSKFEAKLRE